MPPTSVPTGERHGRLRPARQPFCVAAPAAHGRRMGQIVTAFAAGIRPVVSRFTVIRERGNFTGMSPMMSRVPVIREWDSFAGMSL